MVCGRIQAIFILALFMLVGTPASTQTDPMTEVEHLRLIGDRKQMCKILEPLVNGSHQNDPVAHLYYAQCLREQNRFDEARQNLRRVLELTHGWPAESARNILTDMEPVSIQSSVHKGGRKGYLGFMFHNGVVTTVLPDSPVQDANIRKSDKLISANGISLVGLDDEKTSRYLGGYIGTTVDLVIERGGKRFACKITRGEAIEQDAGLPTKIVASKPSGLTQVTQRPIESTVGTRASTGTVAADESKILPITFRRRTSESNTVQTEVIAALRVIPQPLLRAVAADGVKVVITPTIPDALNNSATDSPRGYSHGGGYHNCAALYSIREKTIYIAERASHGNSAPDRTVWITSSLLHEFGHALDEVRKISSSDEFASAYKADCDKLSNTISTHYFYYTQNEAGPSELFAELFSQAVSRRGHLAVEDANMPAAFSHSFAVVSKIAQ